MRVPHAHDATDASEAESSEKVTSSVLAGVAVAGALAGGIVLAGALAGGIVLAGARYHGLGAIAPRKRSGSSYGVPHSEVENVRIVPADSQLAQACPALRDGYRAPWLWGGNGLAQTLYNAAFGRTGATHGVSDALEWVSLAPNLSASDENMIPAWELTRRGVASVDVAAPPRAVVIIVMGFISTRNSSYVRCCAESLLSLGFRAIVLQHSGVDKGIALASPRLVVGCGTDTRDLHSVVSWLLSGGGAPRGTPLAMIGWSMGGNVALKYMVRDHPETQPHFAAAVLVSTFFHPLLMHRLTREEGTARGKTARTRSGHFTRKMQRMVRAHIEALKRTPELAREVDLKRVWAATSMDEFDEAWTKPMLIDSVLRGTRGGRAQRAVLRRLGFAVPPLPVSANADADVDDDAELAFCEAAEWWNLDAFYRRASFAPAQVRFRNKSTKHCFLQHNPSHLTSVIFQYLLQFVRILLTDSATVI